MPKPADKKLQVTVGRLLAELRSRRGFSQLELAEKVGVSIETISRCERGLLLPSMPTLIRLADVHKVTLDELVGRAAVRPAPKDARSERVLRLLQPLGDASTDALLAFLKTLPRSGR